MFSRLQFYILGKNTIKCHYDCYNIIDIYYQSPPLASPQLLDNLHLMEVDHLEGAVVVEEMVGVAEITMKDLWRIPFLVLQVSIIPFTLKFLTQGFLVMDR